MTTDDRAAPRRPVLAAIAVTLSAAIAGVMLGIVLDRTVLTRTPELPRDVPTPPGLEQSPAMRQRFIALLARELDLTDAQRVQVEALIEQESPRMRASFDSAKGIMQRAVQNPQQRMLLILTPEQQAKFRRLIPPL
jgi:Spy/CpxP family protein refolding chaperone